MPTTAAPKILTPSDATTRLVHISPIAEDVLSGWNELAALLKQIETAHGKRQRRLQADARDVVIKTDGYLEELEKSGADMPQVNEPFVHFLATDGSKPWVLCWKIGEPIVSHYHAKNVSCSQRQGVEMNKH